MGESNLPPKLLMQHLIESEPWQAYVQWAVAEFEQVEATYDQTCDPKYQGAKAALRTLIETPYVLAEHASPLQRRFDGALAPLARKRRARAVRRKPLPLTAPLRPSGLV